MKELNNVQYMNYIHYITILLILLFTTHAYSQEEVLSHPQINYIQHQISQKNTASNNRFNTLYQNVIIQTDTLDIPFVDDFSTNTLRSYSFLDQFITDTVAYASGSCIVDHEFESFLTELHTDTAYSYTYDTTTHQIDSVSIPAIEVLIYNLSTCFPVASDTLSFWMPYYHHYVFDSITGVALDSSLASPDTAIYLAEVYFATMPGENKWVDNYAYWNTTYPILPISIGVATLDGLNEYGLPYNNSNPNTYGSADVLTSKPIDLSGLTNDSAVFLSFFYQPMGLGDFPNPEDSLIVEFKNEVNNEWGRVWSASGFNTPAEANQDFKQVYIPVRDTNLILGPKYFYPEFQFRFRNMASLAGNNDHWHIDYVRLDKNRSLNDNDTIIRDVTLLYDFPNILSNYSMMPWDQFIANLPDELADTIIIPIRDNGQEAGISAGAFPIDVNMTNSITTDTLFSIDGLNFNPTQIIRSQILSPSQDASIPTLTEDSIWIHAQMVIAPTDRNSLLVNDTIYGSWLFHNILAYDDGSAERAYGVQGGTSDEVKKFAYRFHVNHEDTIAAIHIHFSHIDEHVENLIFNLTIWDQLDIQTLNPEDHILTERTNQKPSYIDYVNSFAVFELDSHVIVSDTFYVGWSQLDTRNLQVGYDINSTKGHDQMFVFLNNQWNASSIQTPGSPMIRVVLDGSYPLTHTSIKSREQIASSVKVYPNPTQDILHIDTEYDEHIQWNVINTNGQIISSGSGRAVHTNHLENGIYFLYITDRKSLAYFTTSFIKN